jgi:hypothetical protein
MSKKPNCVGKFDAPVQKYRLSGVFLAFVASETHAAAATIPEDLDNVLNVEIFAVASAKRVQKFTIPFDVRSVRQQYSVIRGGAGRSTHHFVF